MAINSNITVRVPEVEQGPQLVRDNSIGDSYIQWTENSMETQFGYICQTPTLDIGCLAGDDLVGKFHPSPF